MNYTVTIMLIEGLRTPMPEESGEKQSTKIETKATHPRHDLGQAERALAAVELFGTLENFGLEATYITGSMARLSRNIMDVPYSPYTAWDQVRAQQKKDEEEKNQKGIKTPHNPIIDIWGATGDLVSSYAALGRQMHKMFLDPLVNVGDGAKLLLEAKATEPTGITPYETVEFDREVKGVSKLAKLRHYKCTAPAEIRKKEPMFIIAPRMNQPEIMDIDNNKSLIQNYIKQGYEVYVVDWGGRDLQLLSEKKNKTAEEAAKFNHDKDLSVTDDVLRTIPAMINSMKKDDPNAEKFHLEGYCQGALIAALYLSVQKEIQPEAGVLDVTYLTPPHKFPKGGSPLNEMAQDPKVDPEALVIAAGGIMPGPAIALGAQMRDPEAYILKTYFDAMSMAAKGDPKKIEAYQKIGRWLVRPTAFPGPYYTDLINKFYRKDLFAKGDLILEGHKEPDQKHS